MEQSKIIDMFDTYHTTTQGLAWAVGRHPRLIGLGAPNPQKPIWLGKAKKGRSPSRNRIGLGAQVLSPLAAP